MQVEYFAHVVQVCSKECEIGSWLKQVGFNMSPTGKSIYYGNRIIYSAIRRSEAVDQLFIRTEE